MKVLVAITGASGGLLGVRLVEALARRAGITVMVAVSDSGWRVLQYEAGEPEALLGGLVPRLYREGHMDAPFMSSSHPLDAMVILPCSMRTLSGVAHGECSNAILRGADNALRMRWRLVVCPRETPLSLPSLENMAALVRAGAIVLPPMLTYYHRPRTLEQMNSFIVGKVLTVLGLENDLVEPWSPPIMV